jgi:hypothetical protein
MVHQSAKMNSLPVSSTWANEESAGCRSGFFPNSPAAEVRISPSHNRLYFNIVKTNLWLCIFYFFKEALSCSLQTACHKFSIC